MKSAELTRYAKSQASEYRLQTDERCEISPMLRRCEHFQKWERNHCLGGFAVHHIAGRNGMESHSFCNLILLSTCCHEFGHQKGGLEYNVSHAIEAACLLQKWKRHNQLEGVTFSIPPSADQLHWSIEQLDAVRSKCVSCKTIKVRIEVLADSLAGTVFGDLAAELLEKVQ